MAATLIVAGLGAAALGFGARYVLRTMPVLSKKMADAVNSVPKLNGKALANSKYYKGGFEPKMTKREAALILNVIPNASQQTIREKYKKMMLSNHPDRGGSPYISTKLSEAKDLLEKRRNV